MQPDSNDNTAWPDRFRAYLQVLARMHMEQRLHAKIDPSDIVQQTLLQAHRAMNEFRGENDDQMAAWLRQILVRNLAHARRDLKRDKRDIRREQSLQQLVDSSSARLEAWLVSATSSPSHKALRNEQTLLLCDALECLPDAQRQAIQLHYFEQIKLAEISERMGRSTTAVAGLLKRGLRTLRAGMNPPEDSRTSGEPANSTAEELDINIEPK